MICRSVSTTASSAGVAMPGSRPRSETTPLMKRISLWRPLIVDGSASPEAERLDCRNGALPLRIDRVVFGLDASPVERRFSHGLTDELHYESTLT